MNNLLDHKYIRESLIKGFKKSQVVFLKISELKQNDEYFSLIGSKIKSLNYKYLENTRLIVFLNENNLHAICSLETFMNISNMNIIYSDNFFNAYELIKEVKDYLVDTIKNIKLTYKIANYINFRMFIYVPISEILHFTFYKKNKDSTEIDSFENKLESSKKEYLYEFLFDENFMNVEPSHKVVFSGNNFPDILGWMK